MKSVLGFIKKETVLTVAYVLAVVSAFWVRPDKKYIDYIDFRSLGILWGLMLIMAGLKRIGFFEQIGQVLLAKTGRVWSLVACLVGLCFVSSMFITNDVALITFVPFAIFLLEKCGKEELFIPVITFQTIAANLGSMLTPIGNPQNLYLYTYSDMGLASFLKLLFPYSLVSAMLLIISICLIKGKSEKIEVKTEDRGNEMPKGKLLVYMGLFLLALLVVAKVCSYLILLGSVIVLVFIMDKKVLVSVDYALLFTFIGFFIFTGNIGRIDAVSEFLGNMVGGREVISGVVASQAMSNVPAALLLSGFTDNISGLIVGVNLGGLGTLIASMASLISFKQLAHTHNSYKGKYLVYFTAMNIVYLAVLLVVAFILGAI